MYPMKESDYSGDRNNVARVKREQAKVRKIVRIILKAGYSLSVWDGEEWAIRRSISPVALHKALYNTDEDQLVIRDKHGNRIGWLYLVYGNDAEYLISDYTDNEITNELVRLIDPEYGNLDHD